MTGDSPSPDSVTWVSTTQTDRWTEHRQATLAPASTSPIALSFFLFADKPGQTIEGFGATFNERGGRAIAALAEADRETVLQAIFGQDGARLQHCRTPVGGTDLSLSWYSYDETNHDFELRNFSIDRDRELLIPFIKAAQAVQPNLFLWSSPWSPPTWMKVNGHYAMTPAWPGTPDNGLQPGQQGAEGQDWFIQEPRYLEAYARYFRRYVEAYAAEGIPISVVMPQNEFNSPNPSRAAAGRRRVWPPSSLIWRRRWKPSGWRLCSDPSSERTRT